MHISFLGKVEAPNKVLPNVSFNIRWNVWYICIPFIKFNITEILDRDINIYNKINNILPIFFIGRIKTIIRDSIDEDKHYKLEIRS